MYVTSAHSQILTVGAGNVEELRPYKRQVERPLLYVGITELLKDTPSTKASVCSKFGEMSPKLL